MSPRESEAGRASRLGFGYPKVQPSSLCVLAARSKALAGDRYPIPPAAFGVARRSPHFLSALPRGGSDARRPRLGLSDEGGHRVPRQSRNGSPLPKFVRDAQQGSIPNFLMMAF